MRTAAAAIAWEFRRHHRWGLMAVAVYLVVIAVIKLVMLGPGKGVEFESDEIFALVVMVPFSATFMYFLAVFSFGLSGDIAARESMYPARMFTLPVTSAALAGWPMLYGSVAMALLWFGTRLLAIWPAEFDLPVIWPGLLAPVFLGWLQALTWMPYPLRGLRLFVAVVWLICLDAIVITAFELKAPEPVMLAILAPHIPIAYLVARFAVTRARCGEVPDWRGWVQPASKAGAIAPRKHFDSASRAQAWFEWRRYGLSLPVLVGILLPIELALLFVFREVQVIVFETLVAVLLTPPLMAIFVAATVSRANPHSRDAYGVAPFIATRPMTSASLIAAKLKVTIWSTLAAWALVAVAIPVALWLSGTTPFVVDFAHGVIEIFKLPRATAIAVLLLLALLLSTWRQLVQSLFVGMTGREWVVKASVFVTLSVLAVGLPLAGWLLQSGRLIGFLWHGLPWIVGGLACLKLLAGGWVAVRLHRSGLVSDRTLLIGALCWDIAVLAVYGTLTWILPGLLARGWFLMLMSILMIPLTRLSAAPLALAWNRHR